MVKWILGMIAVAACVTFFAASGTGGAPAAAALAAPAAEHPSLAAAPLAAGELGAATDDSGCEGAIVAEDAASCEAGGWVATDCCTTPISTPWGTEFRQRYQRGWQTKCCGYCY